MPSAEHGRWARPPTGSGDDRCSFAKLQSAVELRLREKRTRRGLGTHSPSRAQWTPRQPKVKDGLCGVPEPSQQPAGELRTRTYLTFSWFHLLRRWRLLIARGCSDIDRKHVVTATTYRTMVLVMGKNRVDYIHEDTCTSYQRQHLVHFLVKNAIFAYVIMPCAMTEFMCDY